jgi:hypothetical protein
MRPIIGSSISRMLFAALTVFAVSAIPAVAQEASGKFTLAKEVRWGSAVLPAGDYTYALEHQTGQVLFVRNVNGRAKRHRAGQVGVARKRTGTRSTRSAT